MGVSRLEEHAELLMWKLSAISDLRVWITDSEPDSLVQNGMSCDCMSARSVLAGCDVFEWGEWTRSNPMTR